jgi:ribosomal protein S18 acetylase RimI-like enzyme
MLIEPQELFAAVDGTWPAFSTHQLGIWTIREGRNAGQRVSAATTDQPASPTDIKQAADAMRALGQTPLFMVCHGQDELDAALGDMGYLVKDPVDLLLARSADLAAYNQSDLQVIFASDPMAIQTEIWDAGGIHSPRIDVMRNVQGPKSCLLGRYENHPVAAGFVACHNKIAMVHGVEVLPSARRKGVAESMMRGAAWWAQEQGAEWFSCLVVSENLPAKRLYHKLGMETATQYHYRVIRPETEVKND